MSNPLQGAKVYQNFELVPLPTGNDLTGYIRESPAGVEHIPVARHRPPERIDNLWGLSLLSTEQLRGQAVGPASNSEYILREDRAVNCYHCNRIFEDALVNVVTAPGFHYYGHSGFLLVGTEEE